MSDVAQAHPRERMVMSAIELLSERGVAGVTVDEVLARSKAPRGSVYHHFPGGRSQLVEVAVQRAGDTISDLMREAVDRGKDTREVLHAIVRFRKRLLVQTDFGAGCPVAAAVETNPATTARARSAFRDWATLVSNGLVQDGFSPERARRLASMCVSSIEGAIIVSRAERNTNALDDCLAELEVLVAQSR